MSSYDAWADVYDLVYQDVKSDIPFYLEYARQKGSPILEIACGTGRVLIPLLEAGYEVWGIDSSPAMLAKAQCKISNLPENVRNRVHLVQADMRDFHLEMRFPLVLVPFRSFLLLLTVEDQIQTLKNLRRHLKDEGILIIDIFAPLHHYLAQDGRQTTSKIVNPENKHIILRTDLVTYDHTHQLMDVDSIFDEYSEGETLIRSLHRSLKMRYIFRYEMEYLLRLSGLKMEAVYGTFDKKPHDYKAGEMIFVTAKARPLLTEESG